jgi:hypothetical protein
MPDANSPFRLLIKTEGHRVTGCLFPRRSVPALSEELGLRRGRERTSVRL